ncbi:hypothetical protein D3C85_1323760 [compost metagenome]
MRLADDASREIFKAISRAFILIAGPCLRALHLESGDEFGRKGFIAFCAKHHGDVCLLDDYNIVTETSGLYWWECRCPHSDHPYSTREVLTRFSFTAKAKLCPPPQGDSK